MVTDVEYMQIVNEGYDLSDYTTKKEILFCLISELPKATVQAAIGGVPLTMGLECGNVVLTMAVVSIVITAPLGAIGMDISKERLISKDMWKR